MIIPNIVIRFVKYGLVSAVSGPLDYLLIFVFTTLLGVSYWLTVPLAYLLAHSLNYAINRNFAFKGHSAHPLRSYPLFIGFGVLSLTFIILPITALGIEWFGFHELIARGFASVVSGIFNFSMNYFVSFDMKHHLKKDLKPKVV